MGLAACNENELQTPRNATSPPASATPRTPGSTPPTLQNNRAPLISGAPAKAVVAQATYSFKPTATDPDNHPLAFTIMRKPAWATFSPSTGELKGKPSPNDVGRYDNIVIGVTDGFAETRLMPFGVEVMGTASGTIVVNFTPPNQRTDGSAFTDLGGYKLFWGTAIGNYPNSVTLNNGITSYMIEQLPAGTYYLVATVFDSQGVESDFSNVVTKTL